VKALLDEQLSPQFAVLLREAGYDAVALAESVDLVGSIDWTILDVATGEGRAVVTNNIKDVRPFAAERLAQGRTHGA
jgi:predicted nuclease of predicted toxin-antitoxin system